MGLFAYIPSWNDIGGLFSWVKGRFRPAEKARIALEFFNPNIGIAELQKAQFVSSDILPIEG